MLGDSRLILARSHFQLKPTFLRTGYGWCAFWLGLYIGYDLKVVAALLPQQMELDVGVGLAALLSGLSDTESTGAVSPVEETGTGAVCH
jgi:hypothetical protein